MNTAERFLWQIFSMILFVRIIYPVFGISAAYAMLLILIIIIVVGALYIHLS